MRVKLDVYRSNPSLFSSWASSPLVCNSSKGLPTGLGVQPKRLKSHAGLPCTRLIIIGGWPGPSDDRAMVAATHLLAGDKAELREMADRVVTAMATQELTTLMRAATSLLL